MNTRALSHPSSNSKSPANILTTTSALRRPVTGWSLFSSVRSLFQARPMAYASSKWWDASTVAVVTGTNKGIGFEIARELSKQGLTTVMTARNPETGAKAAEQVAAMQGAGTVKFHELDISRPASVATFAEWLRKEYPDGIDILVNNAGAAFKGDVFGAAEAQTTLDTNFYGTMSLTEALKPLLKDKRGRVVNVSSRAGKTSIIPGDKLRHAITSATSHEQLAELANKFVKSIENGTYQQEGWPKSMYGVSKLFVSMYTRLAARELEPRGIMVNALCPGWCQTDMSSQSGQKTALEGADTPVWLALRAPEEFTTGNFFGERHEMNF